MSLWDKAKQLFGQSPQSGTLNTVSEQDHADAIIKVDLPTGQVVVESDKSRDAIANAIQEEGYKVAA